MRAEAHHFYFHVRQNRPLRCRQPAISQITVHAACPLLHLLICLLVTTEIAPVRQRHGGAPEVTNISSTNIQGKEAFFIFDCLLLLIKYNGNLLYGCS